MDVGDLSLRVRGDFHDHDPRLVARLRMLLRRVHVRAGAEVAEIVASAAANRNEQQKDGAREARGESSDRHGGAWNLCG